jgi:hypothetical protein
MNVVPANLAEPIDGFPGFSRGALPSWQKYTMLPALMKTHTH